MVDYNAALPQLQQFQAPNMLAMAEMANKMQLHQAQLAEVQRATNEQNQMRALLGSGIDRSSPEAIRQAYNISMASGQALEKTQAELRNAELTRRKTEGELLAQPEALKKARIENMQADHKLYSEMLNKVLALDDARAGPAYEMLRAGAVNKYPEVAKAWPETFEGNRDVLKKQMLTAEQAAQAQAAAVTEKNVRERPVNINPTEKMPGMRYDPTTNTMVEMGTGLPATANVPPPAAGPAPAAAGAPFAAPANTPAAVMRQPAAAPAVGDAQAVRTAQIEGTGKNPMSSAQGLHQFIDSTFVGTAKKVFPELASKSPTEILALRGTKLADGTPIESALEQRFRADNIASLASAGIQPTPGNTYLAHFLGAGGARSVLGADPNTPVASLLDPRAIAANKSVLEGKTAGEVAAWAASKFSGQPGLSASMTASNVRLGGAPTGFVPANNALMSLGAPTVNNALMANMFGAAPSQNAGLSLQPQIPGAPTPAAAMPAAIATAPAPTGQSPWEAQQARTQALAVKQAAAIKGAEKGAELTATQQAANTSRKESASRLLSTVGGTAASDIEKLIQASTSGKLAADLADRIESITGKSTKGMTNIDALAQIASSITFDIANGKYGSGFTDKDREAVETMSGRIADREKGPERRIAAFKQFINYMKATSEGKELEVLPPAGSAAPKPTGFSVVAPGGKTYNFPTQEAMDQYKKAAGL